MSRRPLHALRAGIAIAAVLALAGCGSSHAGGSTGAGASTGRSGDGPGVRAAHTFTVGLDVLQLSNQVFQQEYSILRSYGRRMGFKVQVADADFDPVTQLQQLDTMLDTGAVQALVINPVDPHALLPVLALAAKKGVPVVFGGNLPAGVHYPTLVALTFDWAEYGRQAGTSLAACIRARLGGHAQVALLEGPPLPGTIVTARIAGERDAIRGVPGAKIVADIVGTPDQAHAVAAFAEILQAHPGVNAVTGVNDDLMLGVADAFREAGIDPRKVCIQGLDDTPQGQASVDSGAFWGDVTLPQSLTATISARVLTSLVRDPRHSPYLDHAPFFIPTRVVTTRFK